MGYLSTTFSISRLFNPRRFAISSADVILFLSSCCHSLAKRISSFPNFIHGIPYTVNLQNRLCTLLQINQKPRPVCEYQYFIILFNKCNCKLSARRNTFRRTCRIPGALGLKPHSLPLHQSFSTLKPHKSLPHVNCPHIKVCTMSPRVKT